MTTLKSFSDARKAFQANIVALLNKFSYTATTFSMRLNQTAFSSGSTKHVVSAEEVSDWISGKKIPSLYAMYKVADFFNISIDAMLGNTAINTTLVTGKSFAKQTAASPKIKTITTPAVATATTDSTEETDMTKTKNSTTNSKMRDLIKTRTTSTEYNAALAYKVLNSGMQLKEIAAKAGVSTRSMRDYMYYGTTIDSDIAKKIAAALRTNTSNLGLKLNKETMRYEHVK
jgi:transcriptional regulator with XRE-family HTH domain